MNMNMNTWTPWTYFDTPELVSGGEVTRKSLSLSQSIQSHVTCRYQKSNNIRIGRQTAAPAWQFRTSRTPSWAWPLNLVRQSSEIPNIDRLFYYGWQCTDSPQVHGVHVGFFAWFDNQVFWSMVARIKRRAVLSSSDSLKKPPSSRPAAAHRSAFQCSTTPGGTRCMNPSTVEVTFVISYPEACTQQASLAAAQEKDMK